MSHSLELSDESVQPMASTCTECRLAVFCCSLDGIGDAVQAVLDALLQRNMRIYASLPVCAVMFFVLSESVQLDSVAPQLWTR